jgi:hypothetical protein
MTKRSWATAAELMVELQQDAEYQSQQAERDRLHQDRVEKARVASEPIVCDLRQAGFAIDAIEELAFRYAPIPGPAIRILLSWLPRVQDERVEEMIVRALAATTEAFDGVPLACAFEATRSEALRWAIGNTLAVANTTGLGDWVLRSVADPASGKARETLAIAAARLAPAEAANRTLAPLLKEFPASVTQAFSVSGGSAELALLEAQAECSKGWQKKEIAKAIRAIQKRIAAQPCRTSTNDQGSRSR